MGNSVAQQLLGKGLSTNNSSDSPSGLGQVMLAIDTSLSKSINKISLAVVFGQHSRIHDDVWKFIFNHQQQCDINQIILEEDSPDEIVNIVKETDYADSESISVQGDTNLLEKNKKTILAKYKNSNHMGDDAPQNTIVDHEEYTLMKLNP